MASRFSLSSSPRVAKSAADAMNGVRPGDNCFIHTAMMAPQTLLDGLVEHRSRFKGKPVNLWHLHTEGEANYLKYPESFRSVSMFCAANDREAVNLGQADFIPVFLSEVTHLWKAGRLPLDFALLQVSPPDEHGYCSLGCSVDVSASAMHHAKNVVAVMNKNVPRTHGDGMVHMSRLDTVVELDTPLPYHNPATLGQVELEVGREVAKLVPNEAVLQMGIGKIPDGVLQALRDHRDLGVHSEMFSDGVMDLMERGVVTGAKKKNEPFQVVGSFCLGSQKLMHFINDNPAIKMKRTSYVNRVSLIASIEKMHAINSCVEVDLTGQVCADSMGYRIYSGVGGQLDFMRGAALSKGGKAIMAFTSRSAKGHPRIVPSLKAGAGVTMTRNHAHWMVTEWGAVDLFGKTLTERAALLTSIAHPDDRADLERAWRERKELSKKAMLARSAKEQPINDKQ